MNHCVRCENVWKGRVESPGACPKCGSPSWDTLAFTRTAAIVGYWCTKCKERHRPASRDGIDHREYAESVPVC